MEAATYALHPIGVIRSSFVHRDEAPRQGFEGGRDAWLEVNHVFAEGLDHVTEGDEIIVVTWLHLACTG